MHFRRMNMLSIKFVEFSSCFIYFISAQNFAGASQTIIIRDANINETCASKTKTVLQLTKKPILHNFAHSRCEYVKTFESRLSAVVNLAEPKKNEGIYSN